MLQANLKSPGKIELENVKIPEPKEDEVLIEVVQAGICGSDIHAYQGKHPFISLPIVMGHEFVGRVAKVGDGSCELLGRRVTALPSLTCGTCHNCRNGRFNICENLKVIGCQAPGAFAEYVIVPKHRVFILPDQLEWEEAVLIEPLAVAVHAVRKLENVSNHSVLVLGTGTIGLMVVAVLNVYGAQSILAVDFRESRLVLAEEFGATEVINPGKTDLAAWLTTSSRLDTTFECVGVSKTLDQGIRLTSKGGTVIVVGVYEEQVMVNMGLVQDKELGLIGTLMYTEEDYHEAFRIIREAPLLKKLITHRFSLKNIDDGFAALRNEAENAIKVIVQIEKNGPK